MILFICTSFKKHTDKIGFMENNNVNIFSEIGKLEGVILHTPGNEIQSMNPENVRSALYSDILNLSVATSEYYEFYQVLKSVTETYQVRNLLKDILKNDEVKLQLVHEICTNENTLHIEEYMLKQDADKLTKLLIEGVRMKKNSLTNFLDKNRYALNPLPNSFFTRDTSMSLYNGVLVGQMANNIRSREAIIMKAIFTHHPEVKTDVIDIDKHNLSKEKLSIEGGDVLVLNDNTILIGRGDRTNSDGIDAIVNYMKTIRDNFTVIVQMLPSSPESFIHLDMVFTLLNNDECMVFEPMLSPNNKFRTISMSYENKKEVSIKYEDNILSAIRNTGIELKPIFCGGQKDIWVQEREQWHSGANFFSLAPGKIIGYERNIYTLEELNNNGYEIIPASKLINSSLDLDSFKKCVVTIQGTELSRGGGGCRCMTMPFKRQKV